MNPGGNKTDLMVGVYQPEARPENPDERLRRLEQVFDDPAARGCDLLVCPELYLSGYFVDDRINERAQPSDGSFAREAGRIARQHNCAIAYGYPERDGDTVYNAGLCVGPDGSVIANHRKNLLPYDYEEKYFQPGRAPTIFDVKGWRVGYVICYETEFPEPMRYYARSGCDLVLAPTALVDDWTVVAGCVVPARAFENTIYVAYSNHAGEENGNRYLGNSVIVSPFGRELARADASERIITARLEHAEITRARERLHFLADVNQSCYR